MEKTRVMNNVIICTLLAAILFLSVGFAFFSQDLNVNGTVKTLAASSSWNVKITDLTAGAVEGYATNSVTTVEGDGAETVEFECIFSAPGDSCQVNGTIKNLGTVQAKYTDLVKTVKLVTAEGETETTALTVDVTEPTSWVKNTTVLATNDSGNFNIKVTAPEDEEEYETEKTYKVAVTFKFEQDRQ